MNGSLFYFSRMIRFFFLGLLLFGAFGAEARVWRGLNSKDPLLSDGTLHWTVARRTKFTRNGKPLEMNLYTVRYTEPAVNQLKSRFEALGAKVVVVRGRDGVTGVARWPNKKARFIVLTPRNDPLKYIIVTWSHPKKKSKKVRLSIPTYPRGKKPSTISDNGTHTVVISQQTTDSPSEIHSFYARKLTALGWKMVVPAIVSHGTIRGLATYQKKNRICFIQASKRKGGLNMITVLVKKGTL